jgi:hypothetical protein
MFQELLSNTLDGLKKESKKKPEEYALLVGNKLENKVEDIMNYYAKNTPFEGSIELISGQKFPDIIAKKFFGVEVKTTTKDKWITTGNSVFEGTRVDGIERIYMLFGKMVNPYYFKCRPYEQCLSEIVVTHSPRYKIDMELERGETIFDKIDIPYNDFRQLPNPIKPVTEYYRQFLKPGDEVWWLEQEEQESKSLIIKLWNNLAPNEKDAYLTQAMVFFPGVFTKNPVKFNKVAVWLVNIHGVVCPNIRDPFTAGGKGNVTWNGIIYTSVPRIIINLINNLPAIKNLLANISNEELYSFWQKDQNKDKFEAWINLIIQNTKYMQLPFNLEQLLRNV